MVGFATASGMSGTLFPKQALAIANTMATYMMNPGMVTGTIVGVSGVGLVASAGPLITVPQVMTSSIMTGMSMSGMVGTGLPVMVSAVASGLSLNFMTLMASGFCPNVSNGAGPGKVVGFVPDVLFSLLISNMASVGMVGSDLPRFCKGLSDGLCIYMNSSVVIALLSVGPPVPPPPVGPIPAVGVAIAQFV